MYEVETGKVIARAFPKFFNFGELATSKKRNLIKKKEFEVFEKMDGSCGIVYFYEGRWRVNTRGSFTSDQAIKATEMLDKYHTSNLNSSVTYIVEIIYPENRIIVDYGNEENLTLLAGFDILHGIEVPLSDLDLTSPFPVTPNYKFTSIDEVVETQSKLGKMEEGFVVRFADGNLCKFKSAEYLKVARLLSEMTLLNFWKAMKDGVVQNEIIEEIPEEFRDEVDRMKMELEGSYQKVKMEVLRDFDYSIRSIGGLFEKEGDRKKLGLFLSKHSDEIDHAGAMFPLLLDKGVDKYIMKSIRPSGNKVVVL